MVASIKMHRVLPAMFKSCFMHAFASQLRSACLLAIVPVAASAHTVLVRSARVFLSAPAFESSAFASVGINQSFALFAVGVPFNPAQSMPATTPPGIAILLRLPGLLATRHARRRARNNNA